MKKHIYILLLLLVALAVMLVPVYVYAAATVTVTENEISVTDSEGNGSLSGGTVTITAKGSIISQKTNNISVTNNGSTTALISFDYTVNSASSFKIAGSDAGASGTYSATVAAGESIAITLVSNSGLSNRTATLKLSNFSYVAQSATVPVVTVTYDSAKGSVSNVANGDTVEATGYQVSLTATPVNNQHSFLGWYDLDTHEFKGAAATLNCEVLQNMRLHAVFVNTANDDPWFLVGGSYVYRHSEWSAGMTKAQSLANKNMVLMNNGTLPAGNYQVNSGVTLLIPCDVGYSTCIGEPLLTEEKPDTLVPSAFRTLTMSSGAHITVASGGTMSIAGMQSRSQPFNGCNAGPQGFVVMPSNTSITVNSTGNLYAWGYITGSKNPDGTVSQGSVTAKSGAKVYECFQVRDWRGGTVTDTMIASENEAYMVLPISQYYVQNIEVPLTLEAGALEYVFMSISAGATRSVAGTNVVMQMLGKALAPYVGPNGLFRFASTDTESCLTKDYDESSDRSIYTVDGNLTMESFEIDLKPTVYHFEPTWIPISAINAVVQGMNTYLDTAKFVLPLNNNITVNCVNSSVLSVKSNVAILPGTQINIAEQAKIVLEEGFSCFVYDRDTWVKTNATEAYIYDRVNVKPLTYAPGKLAGVTRTDADLHDAAILVNGVLQADGDIYSTCVLENGTLAAEKSGANIYSTEYGQVITTPLETPKAETYQYAQSNGGYKSIAITPLWLRNADKTYVETAQPAGEQTTYNYHPIHGFWYAGTHEEITEVTQQASCLLPEQTTTQCPCGYKQVVTTRDPLGHSYETVVTDPTCTTEGYTTYTCAICDDTYTEVAAATGHAPGAAATCTTPQTCTSCGATIKTALGHTVVIDAAIDATCTETGLTEGSHCSVCSEVLVAQEEVAALGHTEVVDAAVAPTCTETGLTEGKHCETCGEVIVAQEVIPALGHNVDGHTCTLCQQTIHTDPDNDFVCDFDGCGMKLVKLLSMNANADAETELVLKFQVHPDLAGRVIEDVTFSSAEHEDTESDWDGNLLTVIQPVASAEMTKDLCVTFSANDANVAFAIPGTTDLSVERSIVDYARAVLRSNSTTQEAMDLVTKLVTYGGYAQLYFSTQPGYEDVPTDYLAYNVLTELDMTIPDLSTANITDSMEVPEAFASVKQEAYLDSAISQDVIFELAPGYSFASNQLTLTYKKTFKGAEQKTTLTLAPEVGEDGITRYVVTIKNIPAAFLNYDYKLEGQVVTPNNEPIDFAVTPKVTAYLGRVVSLHAAKNIEAPVTQELADLANAMWLYNQSAYAFFNQYSVAAVEETEVTE